MNPPESFKSLVAASLILACTTGAQAQVSTHSTSMPVPAHSSQHLQWLDYTSADKSFSMKIPDGWEVKTGKNGLIEVYSYDDESISIWPFFVPKKQINLTETKQLFNALIKDKASGANWSEPKQVGQNGMTASHKDGKHKQVISLIVRPTKFGTIGRLFLAKAPDGYSKHYSNIFSNILSNLKFRPNPPKKPDGSDIQKAANRSSGQNSLKAYLDSLAWTNFSDPKQNAFSLQVPQSWTTQGAMEQPGSLDYRGWVNATSPDLTMTVFMGDSRIPIYTIPNMQLASYGFVQGSRYNPGGYNSVVASYIPANKYVVKYGNDMLGKLKMKNVQLVATNNHPDLARQLNAPFSGLSDYGCSSCKFTAVNNKGTPVVAHFMASTRKSNGLWWVTLVSGALSKADHEPVALAVLGRMFGTFKISSNWKSGQLSSIQTAYAGITQWYNQYNETIRQSFAASDAWRRSFSQQASASLLDTSRSSNRFTDHDEWMRQASNNIRDTEDVVDPNTGNSYNIWSGGDYHYLSNDGYTVLSTNEPIYPSAQWSQLTTLP